MTLRELRKSKEITQQEAANFLNIPLRTYSNYEKTVCAEVFSNYSVSYCYLFGSYAKGKATPTSDVDLLICTEAEGLLFFGLIEELRERLRKKVDVLDQKQLANNLELTNEILKDGIKLYG